MTLPIFHSIDGISSIVIAGASSIAGTDFIDGVGTKVGVGTSAESTPVPILFISSRARYRFY